MRRTTLVVGIVGLWGISSPLFAGAQRPCDFPAVFSKAAVNSLVLPYRYVGKSPTPEIRKAEREIAALVHFEILFSMLKYGSVGSTDLVAGGDGVCDVDNVISKVTRPGDSGSLTPGQTLVVTWGRMFEQGNQLYVQTYVRFVRQGKDKPELETIRLAVGPDDARVELTAGLPTQAVAFPPRRIGKQELAQVAAAFRKTMVVRPQPDLSVPGASIAFDEHQVFAYGVTKTDGDWMWIESPVEGPKGWVKAHAGKSVDPWSLGRWLPELSYIDSICGFMRMRAGAGFKLPPEPSRIVEAVNDGFSRFASAMPAEDAPIADGLAQAVRGFLLWDSDPSPAGRAKAADLFAQAKERMPEYADAVNLATVTAPLRTGGTLDKEACARLGRGLNGVLALDPANAAVPENLSNVYQLFVKRPDWSPYSSEEIKQRSAIVRAIQAKRSGAVAPEPVKIQRVDKHP